MITTEKAFVNTESIPKFGVLLSHFEGDSFIQEQINSIFNQEAVDVKLFIRDDGSSSRSFESLEKFCESHARKKDICLSRGQNLGVIDSFLFLLREVDFDAEFFALSDQDDVWHPRKLVSAYYSMKSIDSPLLYFSAQNIVDEKGAFLRTSRPITELRRINAVFENIVVGCTAVMNKPLHSLVAKAQKPNNATMHDAWLYLVASFCGRVYYDPTPFIDYRQHGKNLVGDRSSIFKEVISRLFRQVKVDAGKRKSSFLQQTVEFYENFRGAIHVDSLAMIEAYVAGKGSMKERCRFLLVYGCSSDRGFWIWLINAARYLLLAR